MSVSDWLSSSIMAKRGIASGETGRKHRSTDAEQGAHHFVYGPYAKLIMTFDPGDTLVVDTEDAFSGKITSETDKPSEKLKHPFLNLRAVRLP
jgi:amidase